MKTMLRARHPIELTVKRLANDIAFQGSGRNSAHCSRPADRRVDPTEFASDRCETRDVLSMQRHESPRLRHFVARIAVPRKAPQETLRT